MIQFSGAAYGGEATGTTFADGDVRLVIGGLVDVRAVQTDAEVGFLDGGQGKTRFGGSRRDGSRFTGGLGEVSATIRGQFGSEINTFVHLKHDGDQRVPIDAVEIYGRYRPVSTSAWRLSGKIGAFFPPVSMENIDTAWQSPYTVTWSAINSWIGEEIRSLGGELTAEYRHADGRVEFGGSLFGGNDPAGIILSKRGWALHDRATTLFDGLPKPTEDTAQEFLSDIEIFSEIDNRPGYYLFARATDRETGTRLLLTYYDNNADPAATRNDQEAWRTRFLAAGMSYELPLPVPIEQSVAVDLVAQGMTGATERINGPGNTGLTDIRFHAGFVMLSAAFGDKFPQTFSIRWDGFQTEDRFPLEGGPLIYDETGHALTLSYNVIPTDGHRFSAELLTVKSDRPARDGTGVPRTQRNTNLIFSYRYSF